MDLQQTTGLIAETPRDMHCANGSRRTWANRTAVDQMPIDRARACYRSIIGKGSAASQIQCAAQ